MRTIELKKLVQSIKPDIARLCGDVKITFALKKQPSIANNVVRNRRLSEGSTHSDQTSTDDKPLSQTCGSNRCKTCPRLFTSENNIVVNDVKVYLDFMLTCKDSHVIYIAQCQLCNEAYFGQTVTPFHVRVNGHRSKFVIDKRLIFEHSALSYHR